MVFIQSPKFTGYFSIKMFEWEGFWDNNSINTEIKHYSWLKALPLLPWENYLTNLDWAIKGQFINLSCIGVWDITITSCVNYRKKMWYARKKSCWFWQILPFKWCQQFPIYYLFFFWWRKCKHAPSYRVRFPYEYYQMNEKYVYM